MYIRSTLKWKSIKQKNISPCVTLLYCDLYSEGIYIISLPGGENEVNIT